MGIVERDGEDLIVPEVFLPKQSCSPTNTDMDQADVAKLLIDLERQGKDPKTLRLWLHSHGQMKCFWSQTDDATIEELANDGFLVSIVTNKAGDLLTRVDVFEPFRFTFDKVRTEALLPSFGLAEICRAEIEEKVSEKPALSQSDKFWEEDLLFGPTEGDDYFALEQKLHDGEITMAEYLARLDKLGSFL